MVEDIKRHSATVSQEAVESFNQHKAHASAVPKPEHKSAEVQSPPRVNPGLLFDKSKVFTGLKYGIWMLLANTILMLALIVKQSYTASRKATNQDSNIVGTNFFTAASKKVTELRTNPSLEAKF
jgi:hypothetical protein